MTTHKQARRLLLASALIYPVAALADPSYSIKLLPSGFDAHDINNAGQIAGNTRTEAWIWSDRGIVDLSAITPGVQVYAINNRGEAAGNFAFAPGAETFSNAFIYSQGKIHDIGRPAGLNYAIPHAINDSGQVAGTAGNFPGDTTRPFFYSQGKMTAIGTFGDDQGDAYGLNNRGVVVGSAALAPPPDSPYGEARAFVYQNGTLKQIVTPGAMPSVANDINDAGVIVGDGSFLYKDGALSNLGGPLGTSLGVNNKGDIVGLRAVPGSDLTHAFLDHSGKSIDLNDLVIPVPGATVTQAQDINDAGQILATVCFGSTLDCRSARLDLIPAVPEPAGMAMLIAGLMILQRRVRKLNSSLLEGRLRPAPARRRSPRHGSATA